MSLGYRWGDFLGEITKEDSFKLLDAFVEAGGNFIDLAYAFPSILFCAAKGANKIPFHRNLYHFGDSEAWVGEWMELRGNREQMVIATKYSVRRKRDKSGRRGRKADLNLQGWGDEEAKDANAAGNHLKSMTYSLKQSLKRLRTDYVDIL